MVDCSEFRWKWWADERATPGNGVRGNYKRPGNDRRARRARSTISHGTVRCTDADIDIMVELLASVALAAASTSCSETPAASAR